MGLLLIHGWFSISRLQRRDKVKGWGEYRTDCNLDKATFGKGKLGVNLNAIEKLETYKLNSIFI